ncbi:hypothetical protein A4X09_0g5549 [Tilletia walkeri]|uniref:Uncharacterized protein n=1 Tax=Tilletia walkeri TaxID=117179 RepID=A0A8X7T378_9BASI|nr:hypothetical protein A4X09_0g5549 [Tilletia walkeri]
MNLRDASVRKLPTRFADAALPSSAGDTSSKSDTLPPSISGGSAPKSIARGSSPITPGPPADYEPPSSGRATPTAASSVAAAFAEVNRDIPLTSSISATKAPTPAPLSASTPAKTGTNSAKASHKDALDDVVPASDAERILLSPSEDAEEQLEIPTSAQRPHPRIYVPAKPSPDPQPSGAQETSTSRRFQPDRDTDFFLRRKVARSIETNPPAHSEAKLDDTDDSSLDKAYEP